MDKNTISTLESEIQNYTDENNFTIYHDECTRIETGKFSQQLKIHDDCN